MYREVTYDDDVQEEETERIQAEVEEKAASDPEQATQHSDLHVEPMQRISWIWNLSLGHTLPPATPAPPPPFFLSGRSRYLRSSYLKRSSEAEDAPLWTLSTDSQETGLKET